MSVLAVAEQLDSAGQHSEAINALARATGNGDLDAMTRLGERLLFGDRAPHMPGEGAQFVIDAARAGSGRAAARIAVLSAMGLYLPQNWNAALDALVLAAEHDWEPAQAQVRVLTACASVQASQMPEAKKAAGAWRALSQTIDLRSGLALPPATNLHEEGIVRAASGFINAALCDWLIAQARGRLVRARVYDAIAGTETTHQTRTNTSATWTLADVDFLHVLVQARMALACGVPVANFEAPAVLHYDTGEQITEHVDFVDPRAPAYALELAQKGQRVVTFLIYLNEGYEGGETDFPKLRVRYRGHRGDALWFVNARASGEPDLRMVHAGRPPLSGEKWIVSQFIRGRSVRQMS